jgi:hypothetical protein
MSKAAELAKWGEVSTNGQVSGRRNIIINGAMNVAQRNTSSTGSGYSTLDRFGGTRGTVTATQSQESLTSSDSPYSLGFRNYFRMTNTGVTAATASYCGMLQRIEAQNIANSGWDYPSTSSKVTISFWVRSSLAGTYYMNLRSNDGTSQNFAIPVVLSANTWTKITKTVSGDSDLTFNNDNGIGLEILLWMHLGTDYTTSGHTVNQWNAYSATDQAPDYPQNWNNTDSATFDFTGVQLEVGSVATPFEHRSFGEELQLCRRYLQYFDAHSNYDRFAIGTATTTDDCNFLFKFNPYMRDVPTLVHGTLSEIVVLDNDNSAEAIGSLSIDTNTDGPQGCNVEASDITSDVMTAGDATQIAANNTANAFISFDSEL